MPKPPLKAKFSRLEDDIIETLIAGHQQYRPDLPYPQSHSDLSGGVRALMRRFDIKPRAIPLDTDEMLQQERKCVVCGKTDNTMWRTLAIHRDEDGQEAYAHADCVVLK